ncbi:unnamed protein product [Sphagnum jensenii]
MEVWMTTLLLIAVLLEALVCNLSTVPGVSAQTQGPIFVDCGSNASYVDKVTNISWVPDAPYITSGVNGYVPSAQTNYSSFSEFTTVRYFPDSRPKNCYTFPVSPKQMYLIRGTFFYGSYDNATTLPSFKMGIDGDIVANVTFHDADTFVYHEFSYLSQPTSNVTFLCLIRDSSKSVPFISAISLSQLSNYYYAYADYSPEYFLKTKYRLNFGGNGIIRFPDDDYDRYWFPVRGSNSTFLNSTNSGLQILTANHSVLSVSEVDYPPNAVMRTALTDKSGNMTIYFPDTNSYQMYMLFYYAELDPTANATSRTYYVEVADNNTILVNPILNKSSYYPNFLFYYGLSYYDGWNILLYPDPTSPLGPLVNALEFFEIEGQMVTLTNPQDALAIEEIKSIYNLTDWGGDPCLPIPHPWVTCRFDSNSIPSITAVNLAQYNLSGPISHGFNKLLNLMQLNLQNNSLSGELPYWLVQLPHLSFLYTPGNLFLESPISNPKSTNTRIIIGPIVSGSITLVVIICVIVYFQRKKRHGKTTKTHGHLQMMKSSHQGAKPYSLDEVIVATNNFKTMIGKGGFGNVYYGKLEDGQEVAIKELDVKSTQGPSEFFNEVDILSRVSHRNLVSLIGYCHEDDRKMLIYEYMHNGTLRDHLYGDLSTLTIEQLDWKTRMNIALNAAQGLEYLHSGSNQSIIHRDVKSNNILLSSNMEIAKVADFGLSRLIYGKDDITHVTTNVKGTAGYLDPEYFTTQYLSPKSDVYGFGVVLLEIISGRMPIDPTLPNPNAWNLCEWVRSNLQVGNIDKILDPIVKASNPQLDGLWKVAEIAIQCVEPKSIHRPTMTKVVEELRAALLQESLNPTLFEYSPNDTYGIQDEYGSQIEAFDHRLMDINS